MSKPDAARALVGLLARAFPDRRIHVVADAVLYALPPTPTGKRGHPAWKGAKLGTRADLTATATWRTRVVTRYGTTDTVRIATLTCLWWGSPHRTPVTVVLVKETDPPRPYDIALVSTDTNAPVETVISRYADRWSVEQTIKDSKVLLGAGHAANRLRRAVERTVPCPSNRQQSRPGHT